MRHFPQASYLSILHGKLIIWKASTYWVNYLIQLLCLLFLMFFNEGFKVYVLEEWVHIKWVLFDPTFPARWLLLFRAGRLLCEKGNNYSNGGQEFMTSGWQASVFLMCLWAKVQNLSQFCLPASQLWPPCESTSKMINERGNNYFIISSGVGCQALVSQIYVCSVRFLNPFGLSEQTFLFCSLY